MNSKQIIAFAFVAVLALALVPSVADDSDAATAYVGTNSTYDDFDSMNGGTLTFTVNNTASGSGSFTLAVTVYEGDDLVGSTTVDIAAGETAIVSVDMSDFTSVGTHTVTVHLSASGSGTTLDHSSFTATIVVDQNILNNWMLYAAIIIIVIIVVIFLYLRMRNAPKKTPDMTFEQLEEQRKAEMAAKSDKKSSKKSESSTERQRYLDSKNKKE